MKGLVAGNTIWTLSMPRSTNVTRDITVIATATGACDVFEGGGSSYELGVSKNQWSLRKSRIHWHAMYKYARTYMYLSVLPPSQDVYD